MSVKVKAKRKPKLKIIKLSSLKSDPRSQHTHEAAFRRGYHHGVHACLKALKRGMKRADIDRLETAVRKWRDSLSLEPGACVLPPAL